MAFGRRIDQEIDRRAAPVLRPVRHARRHVQPLARFEHMGHPARLQRQLTRQDIEKLPRWLMI